VIDTTRHLQFINREEVGRPLITFWVGSYFPLDIYPNLAGSLPRKNIQPNDISIPKFLKDIEALRIVYKNVEDDSTFVVAPIVGFPWLEAMLGCSISISGGTFWAEPFIQDWNTDANFSPPQALRWLEKLQEIVKAIVQYVDGEFPISFPILRGSSDLIAAARGHSNFPIDLYDYKDEVERLISNCTQLWQFEINLSTSSL
jgi:hypothetical protein